MSEVWPPLREILEKARGVGIPPRHGKRVVIIDDDKLGREEKGREDDRAPYCTQGSRGPRNLG